MSKVYLRALKKLPEDFVCERTMLKEFRWDGDEPAVVAANISHPPIVFRESVGEWELLEKYMTQPPHGIYPKEIQSSRPAESSG